MIDTLNDKIAERQSVVAEMQALNDDAKNKNGGAFSAEQQEQYDRLYAKQDELKATIGRLEKQAKLEREVLAREAQSVEAVQPGGKQNSNIANAFNAFIQRGQYPTTPLNSLQADSDTAGGYLVPPEEFVAQLIKDIDNQVFVRSLATVLTVGAGVSLGVPSLDSDPSDADWTTEIQTVTEDTAMTFGKRELEPKYLTKLIKASMKLLRAPGIGAESLIRERLAYKFGVTQENAFMNGTGSGQPLGVFTASANGISTAQDVATGNTATAIGADNIFEVKYKLKSGYLTNARWVFHRDALKQVSKLKDGDGQYLWQPGLTQGQPDTLLGLPVVASEYAPNTFTTGKYVGILGDFSYYYIAESMGFELQRLQELYAPTNQVGFIGRLMIDGMPALQNAFARVTLA